jgi:hypothetical protein
MKAELENLIRINKEPTDTRSSYVWRSYPVV